MEGENGDGHSVEDMAVEEVFKGAHLNVKDLKRPDGILTHGLSNAQTGVLQRAMTAERKDADYRQELKTAFFLSTEESDKVVAAINEADRYGCSLKPIVDWLIARSAGVHGGRLRAIFETISHTTFTTNYTKANKNHWGNKNGERIGGTTSDPLS